MFNKKLFILFVAAVFAAGGVFGVRIQAEEKSSIGRLTTFSLFTLERNERIVPVAESVAGSVQVLRVGSLGKLEYDVAVFSPNAPDPVYTGMQPNVTLSPQGNTENTSAVVFSDDVVEDPPGPGGGGGSPAETSSPEDNNSGEPAIWEYANNLRRDLNYYIQVIASLRGKITSALARLTALENSAHGAGNIAFIYTSETGSVRVLKTDGTVWLHTSGWIADQTPGIAVPVPVLKIADWQFTTFLDDDGNVWRWDAGAWTNFGHP